MTDNPIPSNSLPPRLSRIFLVAADVVQWTPAELAWLNQHPKYSQFEEDLRNSIKRFGLAELLNPDEMLAFSQNSAWQPHEQGLPSIVESTGHVARLSTDSKDEVSRPR